MISIDTPLLIGTKHSETESIYCNIIHIADASSWYRRQPINEEESLLFQLVGYEVDSLINKNMSIHIDDKLSIFMINKNYVMNGMCQTKTHLMVCKNFDFLNDLKSLGKNNLSMRDFINIQEKRNKDDMVNMLYMLNVSANNDFLKFNILDYEVPIYKYLKRAFWLGDEYTNIKIYKNEIDVTKLVEDVYVKNKLLQNADNQKNTVIPETPRKRKFENMEY
tara:strand:- start:4618 stop:5280 length:663 start_codon:yes stop_codon:yes gene_type:complete